MFSNQETLNEKELESYSLLSVLSDLGGSLGMFLGFSFLMVWDTATDIVSHFWHKYSGITFCSVMVKTQ